MIKVDQAAFGTRLRRERERREIPLGAVAESTKIKQSLLAGLEQGDLAHWPAGIFRRAFVREYAAAIGLSPDDVVVEFVRIFPEPGDAPAGSTAAQPAGHLRLTLAREPRWKGTATRAASVLMDMVVMLATAAIAASFLQSAFWTTAAVVGLSYSFAATLLVGRSPALWLLTRERVRPVRTAAEAIRPSASASGRLHVLTMPARPATQPEIGAPEQQREEHRARSASR